MEPKFVKLEEMKVVGMQILASTKYNIIGHLWNRIMKRADEIKNVSNPNLWLGACFDAEQVTDCCNEKECSEMQFFYLSGRPVNSTEQIPEGMLFKTIPAGEFAVFTHKGKLDKLSDTYNYIYSEWFPKSGREYNCDSCDLEWYDERFNHESDDSEFDIYVPVK